MIQYLDNIQHKDSKNFFLIAGPCIIEGEDMALRIAEKVINITDKYNIPYIFKVTHFPVLAAATNRSV